MSNSMVLLSLLFACIIATSSCTPSLRGVHPSDRSLYSQSTFTCKDGSKSLPVAKVNDDFCDCADGTDEPGTSACSNGSFFCPNAGSLPTTLFSSRVDDGICDCCDGSDEATGVCSDVCEEEGRGHRLAAEAELEQQLAGLAVRTQLEEKGKARLAALRSSLLDAETALLVAEVESKAASLAKDQAASVAKGSRKTINAYKKQLKQERMAAQLLEDEKEAERAAAAASDGAEQPAEKVSEDVAAAQEYLVSLGLDRAKLATPGEDGKNRVEHSEDDASEDEDDHHHHHHHDDDDEEEDMDPESMPAHVRSAWDARIAERKAREKAREAKRVFSDAENAVNDKKSELDADYGPNDMYGDVRGQCFELDVDTYTYKMCPFDEAKQGNTLLGRWEGFGDDYSTMLFTKGTKCWNGPARSATVHLTCGAEFKLLEVSEPNVCEYHMQFSSPGVCSQERVEQLQALVDGVSATVEEKIMYF